jgi:hypothetical protein
MKKAQFLSALSSALILAMSILNLAAGDRLYPKAGFSGLFFVNDIVNIIAAAVFIGIVLVLRPVHGLFIGINAAVVYLAVPLILAYAPEPQTLVPAAALVISIYGVVDRLKLEEVLASEKGPIALEHIVYLVISLFFCVLFIVRSIIVLVDSGLDDKNRITCIADLALAAVWMVLIAISLINADKRVQSLEGVMISGTALELSLVLYLTLDALMRKEVGNIVDIVVVSVMSLFFVVPSYRLLRGPKRRVGF